MHTHRRCAATERVQNDEVPRIAPIHTRPVFCENPRFNDLSCHVRAGRSRRLMIHPATIPYTAPLRSIGVFR